MRDERKAEWCRLREMKIKKEYIKRGREKHERKREMKGGTKEWRNDDCANGK